LAEYVTQGLMHRSPFARDRERDTDSSYGQHRRRHRSAPVGGAERAVAAVSQHRRQNATSRYNTGRLQISGGIFRVATTFVSGGSSETVFLS